MQCNQPMYNCPPNGYFSTLQTPLQHTDVIGEGEVTSLLFPGGNMQFYFVPTIRRERLFPYSNIHNANAYPTTRPVEIWYIRGISNPSPANHLLGENINIGDPFLKSHFLSKTNICPAEFYQKFHNDNCSSTTDINYFCPNRRVGGFNQALKQCRSVQVEQPSKCSTSSQSERNCTCSGATKKRSSTKTRKCCCDVPEVSSVMSVDNESSSYKNKTKRVGLKSKGKRKSKEGKRRLHCECHKVKADKQSTTYTDQACNSVSPGLRGSRTCCVEVFKLNTSDSESSCCNHTCNCADNTDSSV